MNLYSQYIFPWLLDKLLSREAFMKKRREVLANAYGKVLEIGVGTGLNFAEYSADVKEIYTVDVNPGMTSYAQKRAKAAKIKVHHHVISAEKLPFADGTFDTVVSTWTLCSIPDANGTLKEIKRILKPEGKFVFIEHGLSNRVNIQKWQNRLNPIWGIFADGCHLNRNIRQLVEKNGFKIKNYIERDMPGIPQMTSHMYEGVAEKVTA